MKPETLGTALGLHRELILNRHLDSALSLAEHLSQSVRLAAISEELERSIERYECRTYAERESATLKV